MKVLIWLGLFQSNCSWRIWPTWLLLPIAKPAYMQAMKRLPNSPN